MSQVFARDVYVLAGTRSRSVADDFSAAYLRDMREAAGEYEFPQYADKPSAVYDSADQLLQVLLDNPREPYGLYWNTRAEGPIRSAMLFFTSDGGLVAGLTVSGSVDVAQVMETLASTVSGRFGYTVVEEPPPEESGEFMAFAQRAAPPAISDGVLRI